MNGRLSVPVIIYTLLFVLFCRKLYRHVPVPEQFFHLRRCFIGDMAEPRIRPGIRAVEHDDLIAGIEDDIARLGRRLRVVSRKACSDGADLLEAAVH